MKDNTNPLIPFKMEYALVWNVMFYGIEQRNKTFAKCFGSYEEANKFMDEYAENQRLTFRSEMGWTKGRDWEVNQFTIGATNDHRLDDKDGNSYYFVITVHEVKVEWNYFCKEEPIDNNES